MYMRQLTPGDAALYRSIRLEGLKESPEAFGSTFEVEFTKPLAWFFDRLSGSVVFGAIRDAKILGVAGFAGRQEEKEAHKGLLWGMYVRPDARGAAVADGWARGDSACEARGAGRMRHHVGCGHHTRR